MGTEYKGNEGSCRRQPLLPFSLSVIPIQIGLTLLVEMELALMVALLGGVECGTQHSDLGWIKVKDGGC